MKKEEKKIKCGFCGKNQDQVKKIVASPNCAICDECVLQCVKQLIMAE